MSEAALCNPEQKVEWFNFEINCLADWYFIRTFPVFSVP